MPQLPAVSHHAPQHQFVAILPRVLTHARIAFRSIPCAHARAEAEAEVIALAWLWYARLVRKGKKPDEFVSAIAGFAARTVRSGRRLCGQERAGDALSPLTQARRGFAVIPLPTGRALPFGAFDEALRDNARTPVPEQVSFRLDFTAWLATRTDRDRAVISDLMTGERTLDVSERHRLSPGRVSQLRREFMDDWFAFCEPVETGSEGGAR